MKKTIGYVRVSSAEQSRDGVSLAAQAEKIYKYFLFEDIPDYEILIEETISATVPLHKRPVGSKIIEAIENGEVEVVVVTRQDRIFRKLSDCAVTLEEWEGKVALHLVDEGGTLNTATPDGFLQVMMRAAFAEYEARIIRHRTKVALDHKKSKGEVTNHPEYGFDIVDGRVVRNEDEQIVIGTVRDLRDSGAGYKAIAAHLNDHKVPTKKAGAKWHAGTVRNILSRDEPKQ